PDTSTEHLYHSWRALILTLVIPALQYTVRMLSKQLGPASKIISLCSQPICEQKTTKILCLFFDHNCKCLTLAQVLVHFGLFPTTPS
ncbi:hypothetical protein BDN67DRAFT_881603, partial [Paxillus ammoniavirescens]